MRIPTDLERFMYAIVEVDREVLHEVLREMAPVHLKPAMRKDWTTEHPTRNFCYVVTEWLVKILYPNKLTAWSLEVPGDSAKHYYATLTPEHNANMIVDLTAEQFPDWSLLTYTNGKKARFMPPSPSKRARVLHDLYTARLADRNRTRHS